MADHPDFDQQWAAFLAGLPSQALSRTGLWVAFRSGEWRFHTTEDDALADAIAQWGTGPFVVARIAWPPHNGR